MASRAAPACLRAAPPGLAVWRPGWWRVPAPLKETILESKSPAGQPEGDVKEGERGREGEEEREGGRGPHRQLRVDRVIRAAGQAGGAAHFKIHTTIEGRGTHAARQSRAANLGRAAGGARLKARGAAGRAALSAGNVLIISLCCFACS